MSRTRVRPPRFTPLIVALALVAPACGGSSPATRDRSDAAQLRRVMDTVFARIAARGLDLPEAGRVYANISLAMLVAQSGTDSESSAILRLVSGAPRPNVRGQFDTAVAAVAAATSVARNLMPEPEDRAAIGRARDSAISAMAAHLDSGVLLRSVAAGARVASAVLARASTDGADAASEDHSPASRPAPGAWAPTPPSFLPASKPGWGGVRRFLKIARSCYVARPRRGADPQDPFAEEAALVRTASDGLTAQQKLVATFWDDSRGATGTTVGHWVNIALAVSAHKGRGFARTVNALALSTMAMADAVAGSWRARFRNMTERPVSVIQRSDPAWLPFLETPPTPDDPSAHAAVSRAAASVLAHYLGESAYHDPGFGVTARTRASAGVKKQVFESFGAAARQAGLSRLWAGVEFRMSVRSGDVLGACIGDGAVTLLKAAK